MPVRDCRRPLPAVEATFEKIDKRLAIFSFF